MHIQTTRIIPCRYLAHPVAVPLLVATEPPPDHYYAENLLRLIETVQAQYDDVLTAPERAFGASVAALSIPAQRLFARLIGRKGPLVRVDTLAYREVEGAADALAELETAGLVLSCPEAPPEVLLGLARRAELGRWFPTGEPVGRKDAHVERILARYPRAGAPRPHGLAVPLGGARRSGLPGAVQTALLRRQTFGSRGLRCARSRHRPVRGL